MNLIALANRADNIFDTVSYDVIENAVTEYDRAKSSLQETCAFLSKGIHADNIRLCCAGQNTKHQRIDLSVDFEHGERELRAISWKDLLNKTDIFEYLPAEKRNEWDSNFIAYKLPDFTLDNTTATIDALNAERKHFFAQKVEGCFRYLSGEHVTNQPMGFRKRMIYAGVFDQFGLTNHRKVQFIVDLVYCINKLLDMDNSRHHANTDELLRFAKNCAGEWVRAGNNTLRIKVFKKGTVHIEIHPAIAHKLNKVLNYLHPNAIPHANTRPFKESDKLKDFEMSNNPLPTFIINWMREVKSSGQLCGQAFNINKWQATTKTQRKQFIDVMASINIQHNGGGAFSSDEYFYETFSKIAREGFIPDDGSYQFYPTTSSELIETLWAQVKTPYHSILEPSAGLGSLLSPLDDDDKQRVTCVELSPTRCEYLRENGFENVICADFMQFICDDGFDLIVMNPPFSEGRAKAHVEQACKHLNDGGQLLAIVPPSFKSDLDFTEIGTFKNAFSNTSVAVKLIEINRG